MDRARFSLDDDPGASIGLTKESMYTLLNKYLESLFYSRDHFRQYCEIYAKQQGLKPYGILSAHGSFRDEEWTYDTDTSSENIQDWIAENDGAYGTLIIACCNSEAVTPDSERSLLFVPDRTFELFIYHPKDGKIAHPVFSIIKPGGIEIDSYTIRYELEQLKRRVG